MSERLNTKRLKLRSVGLETAQELLPAYNGDERFQRWSGYESGLMSLEELQVEMQATLNSPDGKIWRIEDLSGQLVGVAETVRWPNRETGWIGLLMICHEFQGQGYGLEAADGLESYLLAQPEIKALGLAVLVQNTPGLTFWEKRGYVRGELVRDNHRNEVYTYHKQDVTWK